jgi:hypothetical protein
MRKKIVSISLIFLTTCKPTTKNQGSDDITSRTLLVMTYHKNGNIRSSSEITPDSILNGLETWYDSLGRKCSEITYQGGQPKTTSKFYENGQKAEECIFAKDTIAVTRTYYMNGKLASRYPINPDEVGKTKISILNKNVKHFLNSNGDTFELSAENLPISNRIINVTNARVVHLQDDQYFITPLKNSKTVKLRLLLRRYRDDEIYIPIDSAEFEVKNYR